MNSIDRGSGSSLVLVPGLQGRWEYLRPAVEALAGSFRVLTFPLCGERASRLRFDPSRGLDNYADQILGILDARRIDRAVICGVSCVHSWPAVASAQAPSDVCARALAVRPAVSG